MEIRFKEGYKKFVSRRIKEENFKEKKKRELIEDKNFNFEVPVYKFFNGYYMDRDGKFMRVYKRNTKFNMERCISRTRRKDLNQLYVCDIDVSQLHNNAYKKIISSTSKIKL